MHYPGDHPYHSPADQKAWRNVPGGKAEKIGRKTGRTVSYTHLLLYMEGGHSGKQSRAILVVVSGRELQKLNRIVMDIDDQAFMIVSQVGEVRGRGFTLTKKYE